MSIAIRDFLRARRDRALGSIMGHLEREIFEELTPAERNAVRNVVLDALNSYHDSVLDLMKADTGALRNDELVAMLARIEQAVMKK